MAVVVFLRGVNVGGHQTFRPSVLAADLKHLDAVNIGAAGTFVIRKPVSQKQLRAEFAKRLPFETAFAICDGREILDLMARDPFAKTPSIASIARFVSVLCRPTPSARPALMRIPPRGKWMVKVLEWDRRFVVGVDRREMKVISHLGRLDKAISVPVTTRNWNTMSAIAKVLEQSS
jgi:uncharacterized protein (DUF1697 family)